MIRHTLSYRTNSGFTLLELLIAIALSGLIASAAYTIIQQVSKVQDTETAHRENITQYLHLRRRLAQDADALLNLKPANTQFKPNEIRLLCRARVAWNQAMGHEVYVNYRWYKHNGQWVWERVLHAVDDTSLTQHDLKINTGLKAVRYELYDGKNWFPSDTLATNPIPPNSVLAIRWLFNWQHINEWHFIIPLDDAIDATLL